MEFGIKFINHTNVNKIFIEKASALSDEVDIIKGLSTRVCFCNVLSTCDLLNIVLS